MNTLVGDLVTQRLFLMDAVKAWQNGDHVAAITYLTALRKARSEELELRRRLRQKTLDALWGKQARQREHTFTRLIGDRKQGGREP